MNKGTNQDNLDEIEEEIKKQDDEEEKTHHKVSGKSVFDLKKIIEEKGENENKKSHRDSRTNRERQN